MYPIGMLAQLHNLHRQVQRAREQSEPLRPNAPVPKAPRFNEAHGGVSYRAPGDGPEPGVGSGGCRVQNHLAQTVLRVQMQVRKHVLRDLLQIFVNQPEQTQAKRQHQHTLQPFKRGNRPQPRRARSLVQGLRWRMGTPQSAPTSHSAPPPNGGFPGWPALPPSATSPPIPRPWPAETAPRRQASVRIDSGRNTNADTTTAAECARCT